MPESTAARLGEAREPVFQLRVSQDSIEVLLTCDCVTMQGGGFYGRVLAGLQELGIRVTPDRLELLAQAESVLAQRMEGIRGRTRGQRNRGSELGSFGEAGEMTLARTQREIDEGEEQRLASTDLSQALLVAQEDGVR